MTLAAAAVGVLAVPLITAHAQAPLIPALQVDGRGHGHGVGMAQDGALAMGRAGANVGQILGHFYPGTTLGRAGGNVRVPVFAGDGVELTFPDGGEIRGYPAPSSPGGNAWLRIAPGGSALFYRDGEGTRVKVASPPAPTPTTTSTPSAPATTTTAQQTTTTTTLLPVGGGERSPAVTTTTTRPTTTSTTTASPVPLFLGSITATPANGGRVGLSPRNRRYRGLIDVAPMQNGLRFVNHVAVETYLRGMGEVRNPSWPAAGLRAQAIAARTYALRAMAFGGELCDTQRCQIYIGSDAEYAAMDAAVAATDGQVLMYGKSLASAVYSANAGGHTADREEGFGLTGTSHPYLRAAPYITDNRDEWRVTVALKDVASRLGYRGELTAVEVERRGPSGRATAIGLAGSGGGKVLSGIEFDRALGLRSTLFTLKGVTAAKVATLTGGSLLQAPPENAGALASGSDLAAIGPAQDVIPVRLGQPVETDGDVEFMSLVAAALWGAVVMSAFRWRRRAKAAIHTLS